MHERLRIGEDRHGRYRACAHPGRAHGDGFELAMCRQCGDPKCVTVCPAGALAKNAESGVIAWDGAKCVDCLLCTVGCAYGGIALDAADGRVAKCDMCDGAPACVTACPTGALRHVTTARIYNEVGGWEDLFAPGLAGCQGCNTELMMRHTMRRIGPDAVLATPPGCVPGMGSVGYNGLTGTKVPVFHPLLTNTASMLAGVKRQLKRKGREVTAMAIAGDGGASDVGFQSLSGAAERGEEILFICRRQRRLHEHRHAALELHALWRMDLDHPGWRESKGKTQDAKNLPLLMVKHHCAYVATASTAFMEDLYDKLDKAIAASKHGFAYLHVYSPVHDGLALSVRPEHGSGAQGGRDQFRHALGVQPGRRPAFHPSGRRAAACHRIPQGDGALPTSGRRTNPTYSGEGRGEPRHHRTDCHEVECAPKSPARD